MNVEAIVLGAGPSFLEWIKGPAADRSIRGYEPNPAVKLYGCGFVTKYNLPLAAYAFACPPKREFLPTDGTPVYARREVFEAGMMLWDDSIPRGGSAGGMMIGLAASRHQTIGLIGFDGFDMPPYFISDIRGLICYWKTHGKRFVSLMPESLFDDLLERPE